MFVLKAKRVNKFAKRENKIRGIASCLFWRRPTATSHPSDIFPRSFKISSGSFCKSASIKTIISPFAACMPVSSARVWPRFFAQEINLRGFKFLASFSVLSVEPSFTKIISKASFCFPIASTIRQCNSFIVFSSLKTGTTTEIICLII